MSLVARAGIYVGALAVDVHRAHGVGCARRGLGNCDTCSRVTWRARRAVRIFGTRVVAHDGCRQSAAEVRSWLIAIGVRCGFSLAGRGWLRDARLMNRVFLVAKCDRHVRLV